MRFSVETAFRWNASGIANSSKRSVAPVVTVKGMLSEQVVRVSSQIGTDERNELRNHDFIVLRPEGERWLIHRMFHMPIDDGAAQ